MDEIQTLRKVSVKLKTTNRSTTYKKQEIVQVLKGISKLCLKKYFKDFPEKLELLLKGSEEALPQIRCSKRTYFSTN